MIEKLTVNSVLLYHVNAKLTDKKVIEIRIRANRGESFPHLAKAFGVTNVLIGCVVRGDIWTHVGGPLNTFKRTYGERNGSAVKTEAVVRKILTLAKSGNSRRQIANITGVNIKEVGRIARRDRWKHVIV